MTPEEIIDHILRSDEFFVYMYEHTDQMELSEEQLLEKYGDTLEHIKQIKDKYCKVCERYEKIKAYSK